MLSKSSLLYSLLRACWHEAGDVTPWMALADHLLELGLEQEYAEAVVVVEHVGGKYVHRGHIDHWGGLPYGSISLIRWLSGTNKLQDYLGPRKAVTGG